MAALADPGASLSTITWRERGVAAACAILLTAVMTYPTIVEIGSAGRLDTNDGKFSIWNVAWVAHAILDDPRHLLDANIFYPRRGALTYSELNLVAGTLAVPGYAISRNPLAAHNSAVLLTLAIAFGAAWALVRRLTGSSSAAILSATGYTFSAYTSSHTAEMQLLMIFGFPLVMLAFHRLHARPDVPGGLWLGAALAVTGLSCGYYGVFAGGLAGLSALLWMRRQRAYWIALAVAVVAAAAFLAPVMIPYLSHRAAQGVVTAPGFAEIQFYSADWRTYLRSSSDLGVKWLNRLGSGNVYPEVLFPGIALTGGAIVGLMSMRRTFAAERRTILGYAAIACVAVWASLGPAFGLYRWLMPILPGMAFLRAPARLAPVVILAFAVLAGYGFAAFRNDLGGRFTFFVKRPPRSFLTAVMLAAICGELWVRWPLQPMPPIPRAYQLLATLPRGAVVEFPFPYVRSDFHNHARAMLMSTYHWQPLVNGYSDFIPPEFDRLAVPINGFPDAASLTIMRAHDVRYVVIRAKDYGLVALERLRERFPPYARYLHRLNDENDDVWLYQILSYPEAAPPS